MQRKDAEQNGRPRSSVTIRRRTLRVLDVPLADELDDAGSLSLLEMHRHVVERRLLGGPCSLETLREWWGYASRRRLIEPLVDGRCGLTEHGRLVTREARDRRSGALAPKLRALLRYLVPSGVVGLIVSVTQASSRDPTLLAYALVLALSTLAVWAWVELLDKLAAWRLDPWADATTYRRAAQWLDGDAVQTRLRWIAEAPVDSAAMRRLEE